ncbi:hypothetical protein JZ751_017140 [Albula glossodonta]|uniref:Uncharacterized protein n=1 Tax=Albula glossodonta TaxID=121402 RepID=A0A8T2NSL7_9TELE|nr:hypothetical protein JZ751_017140 [Albula glossodonta]
MGVSLTFKCRLGESFPGTSCRLGCPREDAGTCHRGSVVQNGKDRQGGRQTDRQAERQADRQRGRQTDGQSARERCRTQTQREREEREREREGSIPVLHRSIVLSWLVKPEDSPLDVTSRLRCGSYARRGRCGVKYLHTDGSCPFGEPQTGNKKWASSCSALWSPHDFVCNCVAELCPTSGFARSLLMAAELALGECVGESQQRAQGTESCSWCSWVSSMRLQCVILPGLGGLYQTPDSIHTLSQDSTRALSLHGRGAGSPTPDPTRLPSLQCSLTMALQSATNCLPSGTFKPRGADVLTPKVVTKQVRQTAPVTLRNFIAASYPEGRLPQSAHEGSDTAGSPRSINTPVCADVHIGENKDRKCGSPTGSGVEEVAIT